MTKRFKNFLYLIIIPAITIISVYFFFSYVLKEKIISEVKSVISEKINTSLNSEINIESLQAGFDNISLENVSFSADSGRIFLYVPIVKFEFSFLKLVAGLNSQGDAVRRIYLIDPVLQVSYNKINTESSKNKKYNEPVNLDFDEFLDAFNSLSEIRIKQAQVTFLEMFGYRFGVKNLNGELAINSDKILNLNLSGDLEKGIKNFSGAGKLDLKDGSFNTSVQLDRSEIDTIEYAISEGNLKLQGGSIDGNIEISGMLGRPDSISMQGILSLENAFGELSDIKFTKLEFKAALDNNGIEIESGSFNIFNNSVLFDFSLESYKEKNISLKIKSPEFDLFELLNDYAVELPGSIKLDVIAEIKMAKNDTLAGIRINSPKIAIGTETIDHLRGFASYNNGKINIDYFNFNLENFNIRSTAVYFLNNKKIQGLATAERKFSDHVFFDKFTGAAQKLIMDFDGDFSLDQFRGNWEYQILPVDDSADSSKVMQINGDISLNKGVLDIENRRTVENDFYFHLQLVNVFTSPFINYGYFENFPVYKFTSRQWVKKIQDFYNFDGILVGEPNDLGAQVNVYNNKLSDKKLIVKSQILNLFKANKEFEGTVNLKDFVAEFSVQNSFEQFIGSLNAGKNLNGNLTIDLSRDQSIDGSLNISDLNISKIFSNQSLGEECDLNGYFKLSGDLDKPEFDAHFAGNRYVLNDVGYFSFSADISGSADSINISNLNLALNNSALFSGYLKADLNAEQFYSAFKAKNIDIPQILLTFFASNEFNLSGKLAYDLEASGSFSNFTIGSQAELTAGTVGEIEYDNISAIFKTEIAVDSITQIMNFYPLQISKLEFIKSGQYHLDAAGEIPWEKSQPMNLNIRFYGDILSIIPKYSSFFKDAASFGNLELVISGTPDQMRFEEGYLKIEKGEVWLEDVAEHIDGITGEVFKEKGSNRVNFKNLRLTVNGDPLIINTAHNVVLSDNTVLDSWNFEDLGLDFGVIVLKTKGNGVEVNIPSLMIDNSVGFLALSGKSPGEKFYFAGPVDHPRLRGIITVSDSRMTYPFESTENSSKRSPASEFLRNVNWDVVAKAGKDLKYVRKIPAGIGQVDTELDVDPTSAGLEFTGIISLNTFKPFGELNSDRGRLEYLDLNFRVEQFGVEFNKFEEKPHVYGRAWTVVRDSIGSVPKTIYLDLYTVDEITGENKQTSRWEDFRFKLVSADPTIGETQEQVLAYLGYSPQNFKDKATQVGGAVTENYLIRPLLRPVERTLERFLGFDLVRFNSSIAKNLFYVSLGQDRNNRLNFYDPNVTLPYLFLFESSEVTVGKYISQDLYMTYTGQLVSAAIENTNQFTFNHSVGLEYRLLKNILLEFEYDREIMNYYTIISNKFYQEDFKIRLRHSFSF